MAKWIIDPAHSEVQFKVKHLVISTVTGSFNKFEGSAESSTDDFDGASINFSIDVDSVDTNQPHRDGHLKAPDFFDVAAFPHITFASTSFTKKSGSDYSLKGDLTIKGVTKPVELAVEFGGLGKDGQGNIKAGFEISGVINRKEFGMAFNAPTETGGLMLGEDIKLVISVQLAKQATATTAA
jgi:polyisoprenoid-binding protein YceI